MKTLASESLRLEEALRDAGRWETTATPAQAGPAELSVIVPTYNERENVPELVLRLSQQLAGVEWEVIFVDDDSPDGTAEVVRSLARHDPRVRCLQRIGRRGLSSACIEGVMASSAPYVAVMDADLQHDESILPLMLAAVQARRAELAVGSRYVAGGGVGDWDKRRALASRLATRLSHLVVPAELHDPMSGYFLMTREAFMQRVHALSALGFKILMDLFASGDRPLRFVEVPYAFRERRAGQSKLDNQVARDYGLLLLDKLVGHVVPVRFIAFAMIGGLGVLVHLAALSLLYKGAGGDFVTSQAAATGAAMVFNFSLNNVLTYRDRQLKGRAWAKGLLSFMLACSVGALANVGMAATLFNSHAAWWLAAVAGIVVGAVWNFAVTSVFTWGRRGVRAG